MDWDMTLDDPSRTRTDIQSKHKGSNARGISAPGRDTGLNNIMLWWQPERGEVFGYADGWTPDGAAFYFSGTGQEGDQLFEAPYAENGRVRDHALDGAHVRLLRYMAKNSVRYMGELRLDPNDPYQFRDGLDRLGNTRRIIQFRFLPVGEVRQFPGDPHRDVPSEGATAVTAPIQALPPIIVTELEALRQPEFQRLNEARLVLMRQLENALVHEFSDWLDREHDVAASALDIPYVPEARTLRADMWLPAQRVLIEAKASSSRESLRMAIGQLFDYARYLTPRPRTCVLIPARPADDMLALLAEHQIGCAWRTSARRFELSTPALLQTNPGT